MTTHIPFNIDVAGADNRFWTQRDGTHILVRDMEDGHLLASIRMLRRWSRHIHQQHLLAAYSTEATVSADMASLLASQEVDKLERMCPETAFTPIEYDWLLEEAKQRGLESELWEQ